MPMGLTTSPKISEVASKKNLWLISTFFNPYLEDFLVSPPTTKDCPLDRHCEVFQKVRI